MTRKLVSSVLLGALLAILSQGPLWAQQYVLSNTTLNGAITASATTLVLTSASASSGSSFGAPAAGQCLFIDNELMRIVSVASTTATVQRSTINPSSHANSAVIWTGSCGAFKAIDPPALGNNQTCSAQPRPWINTTSGNVWFCNTVRNDWRGTNFATFAYGSTPVGQ